MLMLTYYRSSVMRVVPVLCLLSVFAHDSLSFVLPLPHGPLTTKQTIQPQPRVELMFVPWRKQPTGTTSSSMKLDAKKNQYPTYNRITQRWEAPAASPPDNEMYGPVGSLLRQGPIPFFTRITSPDKYEQAVLKYMSSEKVSMLEAQGNMDAYFSNAADWAYQKMEEKKGKPKRDYNQVNTKDTVLALVWGLFVTPLILRLIFLIIVSGSWDVSFDQLIDFSNS